jgi:hypothetical protein
MLPQFSDALVLVQLSILSYAVSSSLFNYSTFGNFALQLCGSVHFKRVRNSVSSPLRSRLVLHVGVGLPDDTQSTITHKTVNRHNGAFLINITTQDFVASQTLPVTQGTLPATSTATDDTVKGKGT